ncbi:RES family NAD+ phosphorylase [Brevibacterium sp. H602]|uniref:RES family NAD+ phosphorylase n=1 Tax=unclassified Brevibacterium TaxID=2614124 RepID=UPI00397870FE
MDRETVAQRQPDPDRDLSTFPSRPVDAGTRWRRGHWQKYEPWYFASDGKGRFNLAAPFGTCYLASSDDVAAREAIGPDIARSGVVASTFLEGRVVSSLTLAESIQAAHVSSDEAFPFGVTSELCSMAKFQVPRQWAHSLHEFGFEGIWYHPRFSPGADARAIAVFGPAGVETGEVHEQKSLRAVVESMAIEIADPDNLEEFEILDEPTET